MPGNDLIKIVCFFSLYLLFFYAYNVSREQAVKRQRS